MRIKNLVILIFLSFVYQFTNGQTVIDSTKNSKWNHSISLEGQLHNNYIYRSGEKKFSIYKNLFNGDTTNEAPLQWNFHARYIVFGNTMVFSIGVNSNKTELVLFKNDSMEHYFNYKFIGIPLEIGIIKSLNRVATNVFLSVIPSFAINEFRYFRDNYGNVSLSTTQINQLHICGSYGLNFFYRLKSKLSLSMSFSSIFSLAPFKRPYPIGEQWVNYSSFNFGLGLKYNIS